MSRGRTGFSIGPLVLTPRPKPKKRAARPPKAAPVIPPHGGYPDLATWGVAVLIGPDTIAALAREAVNEARVGYPDTPTERIAVPLLAGALREHCEHAAKVEGLPALTGHLVMAGLAAVSWDVIARKALA